MGSLRRSHHAWLLKFVLVLGLFASAGIAVGVVSGADQPSISSDQQDYAPGSTVALSGEGWQIGEAVELLVDDDQDDVWTYETELTADEDGTVSDSFDLPDLAGEFTVTATAPSGNASATFTVTAPAEPDPEPSPSPPCAGTGDETLASDKDSYLPGARAVISATSFGPACDVTIRITRPDDTVDTESVDTDDSGGFEHEYLLPVPAVPGEYLVEAVTEDDLVLASATFNGLTPATGTPLIWTDRDDYQPGQTFTLHGSGWLPAEAITVFVNDDEGDSWSHSADVVAAVDGTFVHEFELPNWFVAVYTVTATGAASGVATTTFTDAVAFGGCTPVGLTINVNTTADDFGTGASCSLREAVQAANLDPAADTINLPAGTYQFADRAGIDFNEEINARGDLDVLQPASIVGAGTASTIVQAGGSAATGLDRVFHVLGSGSLTLSNSTVQFGRLGDPPNDDGAGIRTNGRPLTLSNVVVQNNVNAGSQRDGGGIYSSGGAVSLTNTTIASNTTTSEGGGIYASGGTLNLDRVTINGNSATGASGTRDGGGVWTDANGAWVNVTLTSNATSGAGGGARINGGTTTLTNVTVSHNTAGSGGGISRNSGTASLRNTIVSDNAPANCSGSIANTSNNLDSGATCGFGAASGSQSNANPGLGALAANGGPTMTRSIGSTSPAVDKGTATSAPANDQRGLGRTDGPDADLIAQHDVGAFEFQAPTNTAPTVAYAASPTSANEGETKTFDFAITDPDAADTFTFVSGFPSCGTGGAIVGVPAINSATKTGSFQCLFADGPASPDVQVRVKDAANSESNTASQPVTVANVAPSIVISGAAGVNEGSVYTLTLGALTDPGPDTVTQYVVHWGDGTGDTYTTAGPKTHTYADGTATRSVTVDLVDEDGTHLNRGNPLSVQVDNVVPTIAISGDASVAEGATYSLTLGSVTDPGTDSVSSYVVHWGDGSTDAYGSNGAKTHAYADGPNNYAVTVDLVDEDGTHLNRANAHSVAVTNVPPEITDVDADSPIDEGDSSTIAVTATDPAGVSDPLLYEFDCDGDSTYEVGPQAGNSHDCAYGDNGSFTVNVRVTDGDGGSDTASTTVAVNNVDPTITDVTSESPIDEGESSLITVTATDPAGPNDPLSYAFDCDGDDTFEVGPQAGNTHTCSYDDNGAFTVKVRVTDGDGGSSTDTTSVQVDNVAPDHRHQRRGQRGRGLLVQPDARRGHRPRRPTRSRATSCTGATATADTYGANGVEDAHLRRRPAT